MLRGGDGRCGVSMVKIDRVQRIAERIREELAEVLLREIADPRLQGIMVTDVTVDRELDYANIYVSALEGSQRSAEILAALEHARGFLRSELAQRIDLRVFPRLRFHWDATSERAEVMEHLFAVLEAEKKDKSRQVPAADQPAPQPDDAEHE